MNLSPRICSGRSGADTAFDRVTYQATVATERRLTIVSVRSQVRRAQDPSASRASSCRSILVLEPNCPSIPQTLDNTSGLSGTLFFSVILERLWSRPKRQRAPLRDPDMRRLHTPSDPTDPGPGLAVWIAATDLSTDDSRAALPKPSACRRGLVAGVRKGFGCGAAPQHLAASGAA